jgi:hypothetical protein
MKSDGFRLLARHGPGGRHDRERGEAHEHDQHQRPSAFLTRIETMGAGCDVTFGSRAKGIHGRIPSNRVGSWTENLLESRKFQEKSQILTSAYWPSSIVNYLLTFH